MVLVALMLLYLVLGIILPFIFAVLVSSKSNEGSAMPLIAVYGAYGGFIALSTLAEGGIHFKMR